MDGVDRTASSAIRDRVGILKEAFKMKIINDPVTHPSHYTQGKIEVLDFILDQNLNYLAGNIVKYICRYRYKGTPVQDLKKARFYLDRLIAETEAEAGDVNANHCSCNCQGRCQETRE
jgi:hypothetical protein